MIATIFVFFFGNCICTVVRHVTTSNLFQVYDKPKSWSSAFTRSAYFRNDPPNEVVIAYEGDASKARQFPHGNDKTGTRPFTRTQTHVLHEITTTSARSVYNFHVASSGPLQPSFSTSAPRDIVQVRNVQWI